MSAGGDVQLFAAPLLQIFSVFVSTNFDECEIYGFIRAIELKDDTVFDLYNRDSTEYETISKDGALSLTGPEGDVILGNTGVIIDLCLKDKARNIELIKGKHYLDCVRDDSRDKLMKAVIHGEHGYVCLYYMTFRFAVYATVEVAIWKNLDHPKKVDDVHGSLVASYSNRRHYCNTDDEVQFLETNLFDKPSDKPVKVMDQFPFKLLRSTLAVPAYSSLVINVKLSISQRLLPSILLYFRPGMDCVRTIPFENGHVKVVVRWHNAYRRIYKESVVGSKAITYTTKGTESNTEELSRKVPRHLDHTPYSDQLLASCSIPNGKSKIRGGIAAEIFTVYIGGIDHEVSTAYGVIKVNYGSGGYYNIYNRIRSEAEPLPDDNTVCIELHKVISNIQFNIVVDLKDPIHDLNISRADIGWDYGSVGGMYGLLWFDKRICSVARGAIGYAAVHYMIIKKAVRATFEVSLICDDNVGADVPLSLYGLICARYGEHEYSTEYDKVYYKSRLFNKQRHNPEKLSARDLKVTLIKSVMAVPRSSSLIIEADLKAICNDNSDEEIVSGEEEFSIDVSETTHKEIGKGDFRIKVSVTFDDGLAW